MPFSQPVAALSGRSCHSQVPLACFHIRVRVRVRVRVTLRFRVRVRVRVRVRPQMSPMRAVTMA